MKNYIGLLLLLFIIIPTSANPAVSNIFNKVQNTLEEIDEASEDGVHVQDLYNAVDSIISDLEECGWEKCGSDVKEQIMSELDEIQQIAKNRQKKDLMWIILPILLPIGYFSIKYKNSIITRIRWYLLSKRKIDYEEIQ